MKKRRVFGRNQDFLTELIKLDWGTKSFYIRKLSIIITENYLKIGLRERVMIVAVLLLSNADNQNWWIKISIACMQSQLSPPSSVVSPNRGEGEGGSIALLISSNTDNQQLWTQLRLLKEKFAMFLISGVISCYPRCTKDEEKNIEVDRSVCLDVNQLDL
jgi:hypothetical protein